MATLHEGRQLRSGGIAAPILVLSPIAAAEAPIAVAHDIELAIGTSELLEAVLAASGAASERLGVHIKIDTGMNRYGAAPELAVALAQRVAAVPSLRLVGLMTHFATADEPDERFIAEQRGLFERCRSILAEIAIQPEVCHLANSAAMLRDDRCHGSLVRTGIAMYGLQPSSTVVLLPGMRPVMTVRSSVGRVHAVAPPATVGYGRTYLPTSNEQHALIPIGYADGYRRGLSNRSWMAISGRRVDVVGRVSMDQTVVRLPIDAFVRPGDEVVVFGGTDGVAPTADQLADLLETISYEVLTGVAARVPRYYLRDGQVVAVESLPLGNVASDLD